jgi:hypothetical protein
VKPRSFPKATSRSAPRASTQLHFTRRERPHSSGSRDPREVCTCSGNSDVHAFLRWRETARRLKASEGRRWRLGQQGQRRSDARTLGRFRRLLDRTSEADQKLLLTLAQKMAAAKARRTSGRSKSLYMADPENSADNRYRRAWEGQFPIRAFTRTCVQHWETLRRKVMSKHFASRRYRPTYPKMGYFRFADQPTGGGSIPGL